MRSQKVIEERITFLEKKLENEKKLYSSLCQIEMQSQTGAVAISIINKTKGQIKALKWVLNEEEN